MKSFFVLILSLLTCSLSAEAFNALQENAMHKRELSKISRVQQTENRQHIQYYRGKSNYLGTSSWAYSSNTAPSKKKLYVKKGVKFKLDDKKQAQRLKEAQMNQEGKIILEKENKTEVLSNVENKTVEKKEELNVVKTTQQTAKSKKTDNHNLDAE